MLLKNKNINISEVPRLFHSAEPSCFAEESAAERITAMNKTIKKVWNTFTWALVLCVFILAMLLAGIRLFGFSPYAVLSGSMEPTYHVGALIYVKKVSPETIKIDRNGQPADCNECSEQCVLQGDEPVPR